MKTYATPPRAPERDQDDAALRDNAERVAANDWTPVTLPGSMPNATTNFDENILHVSPGLVTDSVNRPQGRIAPGLSRYHLADEEREKE